MRYQLAWRWCVPSMVLGFVAGLTLTSWPASAPVQAQPAPASATKSSAVDAPDLVSNPLVEGSRHVARVASMVTPSVVHIESERPSDTRGLIQETGSGVLVSASRTPGVYVVTNRHVIGESNDLRRVSVRLHDGRSLHPTRTWIDRATDLAVMQLAAENLTPAPWGDSDRLEIGHFVLAVGSPFGLRQSVTMGIVSARGRALQLGRRSDLVNQDFLQTDAAINPGNSGGPLIDLSGRVVGINTAIASSSGGNEGIGFSIPSNLVRRVVEDLLAYGEVHRAFLGVTLDPDFDATQADRLKLGRVRGARIIKVAPESPADRAGLKVEDVVLSFDGTDVLDENHLVNLVSLTEIGRSAKLVVWRDGKTSTMTVHLTRREESDQTSDAPQRPGMGTPVESMGLTLHEISPALAEQLGYSAEAAGLLVLRVDPRGALAEDFEVYDLLEEVARVPVRQAADVEKILKSHESRGEVLLKLKRRSGSTQRSHIVIWRR